MVVDSNDRERIEQARDELSKIIYEDELRDCLLLVMANKQDLADCMSVDEVREKLEIDKLKHIKYKTVIGTSAVVGTGLPECLDWIKLNYNLSKALAPIEDTFDDAKKSLEKNSFYNYIIDMACKMFSMDK